MESGSESDDTHERRPRRVIRATHFHCYLLRSLDPKHPHKTYIGFTTNPHRRLREHNGDLKNGGARRTRRSGRPWQFVLVVHGFPDQTTALQFEWAWQHPKKSRHIRNAIGDDQAVALSRKRGIRAQLLVLKTLLTECESFSQYSLDVHFLQKQHMDEFSRAADDLALPGHMTQAVIAVEDMPFWEDCETKKTRKKIPGRPSKAKLTTKCKLYCFLCGSSVMDKEVPFTCVECVTVFHECCLEYHLEDEGIDSSCRDVNCPSCKSSLDWCPDESFYAENEKRVCQDIGNLDISDSSEENFDGLASDDDASFTNARGSKVDSMEQSRGRKVVSSSDDEDDSHNSIMGIESTLHDYEESFESSDDERLDYRGGRVPSFDDHEYASSPDSTRLTNTSQQLSKTPVVLDLTSPEPFASDERNEFHTNNYTRADHVTVIDLCD